MNPSPLISIIIPAYNRESVLPDAIESVLTQTFSDFELILVNDGSNDKTIEIMTFYSKIDPRINIVSNQYQSRGGIIEWEPRNDGLKISKGKYIAYLDSDNTWKPKFLETLSQVLDQNQYTQLVHCNSINHYPKGMVNSIIDHDNRNLISYGEDWAIFSYSKLDLDKFGSEVYIDTNEIMHRASVFKSLGYLWSTIHPQREQINIRQKPRAPYRRHNDLHLVERIIQHFGTECISRIKEPLVDFYYPNSKRSSCNKLVDRGNLTNKKMATNFIR